MKTESQVIVPETYRAIDIKMPINIAKEFGIWRTIWGTDIFINGIPILKLIALANLVMWLIMWIWKP